MIQESISPISSGSEKVIYQIPVYNLSRLEKVIDKLARKAAKLGMNIPRYSILEENDKEFVYTYYYGGIEKKSKKVIRIASVVLENPKIKISGYEFIASLEHTEEGNIIRNIKGENVPIYYHTASGDCVHCGFKRYRKNTFVLKDGSGQYKQIGRNCLKDFLGYNAEDAANMAEVLYDLNAAFSASEKEFSGGRGDVYDYLDEYLSYVAECIKISGWCSKAMARIEEKQSTSDFAYNELNPSPYYNKVFEVPCEESKEWAKNSIEWAENLTDAECEKSEYLNNIRIIARREIVGNRQYGMAASIVSSYQKHIGRLRALEIKKNSEYKGEVGKRSVFSVYVDKVIELGGYRTYYSYTGSYLNIMSDSQGNQFIYKGSKCLETGKEYVLQGTVKEHKLYNEIKQTVLGRCKEVQFMDYDVIIPNVGIKVVKAISEADAKETIKKELGIKRAPKGMAVLLKFPEMESKEE